MQYIFRHNLDITKKLPFFSRGWLFRAFQGNFFFWPNIWLKAKSPLIRRAHIFIYRFIFSRYLDCHKGTLKAVVSLYLVDNFAKEQNLTMEIKNAKFEEKTLKITKSLPVSSWKWTEFIHHMIISVNVTMANFFSVLRGGHAGWLGTGGHCHDGSHHHHQGLEHTRHPDRLHRPLEVGRHS